MYLNKNCVTPFSGKYKMRIEDWCTKYNKDFKIFAARMSNGWKKEAALIMPDELGLAEPWKVKRALSLNSFGTWSVSEIANRLGMKIEEVVYATSMPEHIQNRFKNCETMWWTIDTDVVADMMNDKE